MEQSQTDSSDIWSHVTLKDEWELMAITEAEVAI
jgi:hypothetical protein